MRIRLYIGIVLLSCLPNISGAVQPALETGKTESTVIDVWIGTSRAKPSKGIYHCTLNTNTGKLSDPELAAEVNGPGFLAMHPSGSHLYAVCSVEGKPSIAA